MNLDTGSPRGHLHGHDLEVQGGCRASLDATLKFSLDERPTLAVTMAVMTDAAVQPKPPVFLCRPVILGTQRDPVEKH